MAKVIRARDDRVERILKDPKTYFAKARAEAAAEVTAEMAREDKRPPRRRAHRPATA